MTDTTTNARKKVLYIGGHGKVGLLATPKLVDANLDVHSLIRNPNQVPDIEALDATPVLRDLTEISEEQWAELLGDYDVVVWGAGNGGRAGADVTWAVDRDAALASIAGMEKLAAEGKNAPAYIMISYMGATTNTTDPADEAWYAYVESKKSVDKKLNSTDLNYLILGPAALTEEPSRGITVVEDNSELTGDQHTSRDLVADVVAELASRETLPDSPLEFIDGEGSVKDI
ncbi:NAD(P)-binding oxidoreductase [uncultured Corynebacterium sp.]|uniref:NAD(P)-binding oxidoreductase n=1 Tax=uncultured Corynebacterium sp. TaxID=159447 RepID=UPI0025F8EF8B|nr:NAD(P)-binding oxidoreductase [uncultured Corynebacterium sp.]